MKKTNSYEALSQIIAVCLKNVMLMSYAITLGFTTIFIASISGNDPKEIIHFDFEQTSWISE